MKQWFSWGIVLSVLVFSLSNCKKDYSNGYGGGGGAPVPSGPDIDLASSVTLGQYLTNSQGQALYMFSDEVDGANACTGDCAAVWPEFTIDLTTAKLNAALNITDFDTITTASGKKQITYKGWPLHFFGQDSVRGLTLAVSVPVAGKWPVAVKDIADPKR